MKILNQFQSPLLPSKIRQIRQNPVSEKVFLLTESAELFEIDNFILFTRLTPELLQERFQEGKVLREYRMDGGVEAKISNSISDFIPYEVDSFFTVGSENMCAWWSKLSESEEKQRASAAAASSILNYFSKPKQPSRPHQSLKCTKILNESDRSIDRILCLHSQGQSTFALVEDGQHGRVLVLDLDLGLVLKAFKGYRSCAARVNEANVLSLWAENRSSLERWTGFPFCTQMSDKIEYNGGSQASFDENGNLFVYNTENYKLTLLRE